MQDDQEMIEVLYNDCYGGYGISKKATKLYNDRMLANDSAFIPVEDKEEISRTDKVLIEIYKEIRTDIDTKYSKIKIEFIPKKYEKHFFIEEYDGKENVAIDYNRYTMNTMRDVLKDDTLHNDEKINKLNSILNIN